MRNHLKGYQHLKQQTHIRDREVRVSTGGKGIGDMLWPEKERLNDNRFWNRESFDDETGLSGSNPPEDDESKTSEKRQPEKQNGISNPMGYYPNKKELEKPPRPVMSNSDMDAGPSDGTRAPLREKKGTECLIQEKMQKMTEKQRKVLGI